MSWEWCGCYYNEDCLFCGGRGWRFDEYPDDTTIDEDTVEELHDEDHR